ncbi:MAG: tetratricopeptide repeat protein [Hyphomonadaceae bacterium]
MFAARSKLDKGLDAFEKGEWKRARRLLEEALQQEPRPAGFYHLGLLYWRGLGGAVDKVAAVDCFERGAEFGHPGAQTAYGVALRAGAGVVKNNDEALAQFRSAAGGGDREAMVQIAAMSEPDDARRWLMRAAELGYAPAMTHLSDMLMRRDPVEALSWLYAAVTLAADEPARKRAAALAAEMSAKEIDQAQKLGRDYAREIRDRTQK